MAGAAYAIERKVPPRIIKISSKRQVTIPADMYKLAGRPDYALASWQDDGSISIEPLSVRNEESSVKILRSLVDKGFEGDELVEEYGRIVNHIVDFNRKIMDAIDDEAAGREAPFELLQRDLEREHSASGFDGVG